MRNVLVSGAFDPFHVGHMLMLWESKKLALGGNLIVCLNGDKWLMRNHGKIIQEVDKRKLMLEYLPFVDEVHIYDHETRNDISQFIEEYPGEIAIFANGGERNMESKVPEYETCLKKNIELMFGLGGGKNVI